MSRSQSEKARNKLEKLLDHGRRNAWNPAHDVDWDKTSRTLEGLSRGEREALASVLSLVFHSDSEGRNILETICRCFDRTPSREILLGEKVHEFFLQQMDDEDRHASGLRLLFDRLGLEVEPRAMSQLFYSKILLSDRMLDAKLVLVYWYIEILAKGVFEQLKMRFPDSCIDSLFTLIIKDEARHVGFGEIYMPLHVKEARAPQLGQMAVAYYSTAAALPALFKFSHYAKAARVLGFDLGHMFAKGMREVGSRASKLPATSGIIDLARAGDFVAALL